ncbi:hypothetical protein BU17DRAFT_83699 [Hysterangium stoloniferum]|nr:hypothetical protein BU17DRAFT_83699 [Hysterangium stoloniferum]
MVLSVREARGGLEDDMGRVWMILKNFELELGPQDVLTGGQFFAVMRFLCHAQSGAAVDDSLVFVQGKFTNPEPFLPASDSKRAFIKSDVALSRRSRPSLHPVHLSKATQQQSRLQQHPCLHRNAPPSTSLNSFTRVQSQSQSQPPKPPTEPPPASSNPFRISLHKPLPPSLSSASSSSSYHSLPKHVTPPLPPRLGLSSKSSSTYNPPLPPPPTPPKLPKATLAD